MFICNFKLNNKMIFKIVFIIIFIVVIAITGISVYKIFNYKSSDGCTNIPNVANISADNYTNVLKSVHDNLDEHIGQEISFVGYIYRVYDFSNTQFVLARNMIISSDNQTLVVGFLCDYKNASNFSDGTWVNITGKITKGDYHGTIPIIEIKDIKQCDKPKDEFVYPPDDTYIPTSALF